MKIYGNDGNVVFGGDKYEIVYQNSNIISVHVPSQKKTYEVRINGNNANDVIVYPEDILSVKNDFVPPQPVPPTPSAWIDVTARNIVTNPSSKYFDFYIDSVHQWDYNIGQMVNIKVICPELTGIQSVSFRPSWEGSVFDTWAELTETSIGVWEGTYEMTGEPSKTEPCFDKIQISVGYNIDKTLSTVEVIVDKQ